MLFYDPNIPADIQQTLLLQMYENSASSDNSDLFKNV